MQVAINGRFLNQPISGVQRYARSLLQELDQLSSCWGGLEFEIISPRLRTSPPVLRNIPLRQVGFMNGHVWEQAEFPQHVRAEMIVCLGNTAPVSALLGRSKVVATVHDLSFLQVPESYRIAFRAVYRMITPMIMRYASGVITVSCAEKTRILNLFPGVKNRLFVVPNGGALSRENVGEAPFRKPYVLFVGTPSRLKNFPIAMNIAHDLCRRYPDLNFIFLGAGPGVHRTVKSPVDVSMSRQIQLVDRISDLDKLAAVYRSAEMLLFPSTYESYGLPIAEAISMGCPVIASDLPSLRERYSDAIVFCDPHRPESIVEKAEEVLNNPALRQDLIRKGLLRARHLSWHECAKNTLSVLQTVANA